MIKNCLRVLALWGLCLTVVVPIASAQNGTGVGGGRMTYVPDRWVPAQHPVDPASLAQRIQEPNKETDSLVSGTIHFRFDSSLVLFDYKNNAREIERLQETLSDEAAMAALDCIVVTAGASPEGAEAYNDKLAAERALNLKGWMLWKYPALDRERIHTFSLGVDWAGLRQLVVADAKVPHRSEVLRVIDSEADGRAKHDQLEKIGDGKAYAYLSENILPRLRQATTTFLYVTNPGGMTGMETAPGTKTEAGTKAGAATATDPRDPDAIYAETTGASGRTETGDTAIVATPSEAVSDPAPEVTPDGISKMASQAKPETVRRPLFALKTNLLADVATAINVEIEVPIGPRWSVAGEYVFPWWLSKKKQHALQLITGTIEPRYWFGERAHRPQMTGWFLGLYGGGGYYDVEWKEKGHQGEFFHVGLSGGYAHTISRNGDWRLEYSLGVGYLQAKDRKYTAVFDNDRWNLVRQSTSTTKWFGPTRAKVSLVWMLHYKQHRKGGAR